LLAVKIGREGAAVAPRPNTESNVKVAKPQTFNGKTGKISEFFVACRLYIRIRMRNIAVEEVQWILSYVQGELVDI